MQFTVTLTADQYATLITGLTVAQMWSGNDTEQGQKWGELVTYVSEESTISK